MKPRRRMQEGRSLSLYLVSCSSFFAVPIDLPDGALSSMTSVAFAHSDKYQ